MPLSPEDVLRSAFAAVASGDAKKLVELVLPDDLERLRRARVRILQAAREDPRAYDRMLRQFRVAAPEEMEHLGSTELVSGILAGLPQLRTELRCHPLGAVPEGADLVHVLFRVQWLPESAPRAGVKVATLRRGGSDGDWRLKVSPMSEWLVPGLENELVADSFGG